MLIFWVLKKLRALNIQQIYRSNLYIKKRKQKNKYHKNHLKAAFCLFELLVYIQLVTCTCGSNNYYYPSFAHFVEDLCEHAASHPRRPRGR